MEGTGELKVGDVVRLKCNESPKMVVDYIEGGVIKCIWFDDFHNKKELKFRPEVLIKIGE